MLSLAHVHLKFRIFILTGWEKVLKNFDLLYIDYEVSRELIVKQPNILIEDHQSLRNRVEYLKKLQRNIFDPKKPGYIKLDALASSITNDEEFCEKYAKTFIEDYNTFLKYQ